MPCTVYTKSESSLVYFCRDPGCQRSQVHPALLKEATFSFGRWEGWSLLPADRVSSLPQTKRFCSMPLTPSSYHQLKYTTVPLTVPPTCSLQYPGFHFTLPDKGDAILGLAGHILFPL